DDIIKILFNENPGVIIQVSDESKVASTFKKFGVDYKLIAELTSVRQLALTSLIGNRKSVIANQFAIDSLRATWYKTSHSLDKIQRTKGHADDRAINLFRQPLSYQFQKRFDGTYKTYGIEPRRRTPSGI